MAKKRRADKVETPAKAEERDRAGLGEAMTAFARGDYARAKVLLQVKADDPSLPEGVRAQARELLAATKPERGMVLAYASAAALFTLILIVTSVLQP